HPPSGGEPFLAPLLTVLLPRVSINIDHHGLRSTDNAFKELRKTVSHKMQRLQEKNRMLRDELRQEKERHQKTEEELSQQREKRILECKICYMQPDRWVFILCGHMVCRSCAGSIGTTEKCPICRAPITGHIGC
ncbi:uncharacterized protein N7484_010761, partial [Penicillium longicatenatum]|uniref:uncharacterized protein n=1 Tax=Penicillium longicatenatum TaxID=1561947 RepID=UPI00254889E0